MSQVIQILVIRHGLTNDTEYILIINNFKKPMTQVELIKKLKLINAPIAPQTVPPMATNSEICLYSLEFLLLINETINKSHITILHGYIGNNMLDSTLATP